MQSSSDNWNNRTACGNVGEKPGISLNSPRTRASSVPSASVRTRGRGAIDEVDTGYAARAAEKQPD